MNCQEFERQIQKLLDQRVDITSSPAANVHASQCSRCAEKLDLYTSLFDSDSSIKVDGLKIHLAEDSRGSTTSLLRRIGVQRAGGVLAAGVAIVLLVWISFLPQGSRSLTNKSGTEPKFKIAPQQVLGVIDDIPAVSFDPQNSTSSAAGDVELAEREEKPQVPDSSSGYLGFKGLSDLTPAVHQLPSTIQPYYNYTSELPGVKPWASGINEAARLIRDSMLGESKEQPKSKGKGFGRRFGPIPWGFGSLA